MAGFFGLFDPTRPGKGVDPDQKKGAFVTFWEIVWRKLGRLVLLNILYFLILSPIILNLYILLYSKVMELTGLDVTEISTFVFQFLMSFAQGMPSWLNIGLLTLSIVFYGPATAGLTYVLRNYAREEHAWVSDFFSRMMKNFKQGLFFGLLDVVVFFVLMFNLPYLMGNEAALAAAGSMASVFKVTSFIAMMLLVVYLLARNYFYLLAVTFESNVLQILRNSFIFAVVGLWRNLFVVAASLAVMALVLFVNPLVELVLLPFFALAFCVFLQIYSIYPTVKKHMIDPIMEQEKQKKDQGGFYPPVPEGDSLSDPGGARRLPWEVPFDDQEKPEEDTDGGSEDKKE